MNYFKIYGDLIQKGLNRKQLIGYHESHHIIPKCLGGTDKPTNIVKLTAQEHYVAHQLLTKIYPNNQGLIYAAFQMQNNPSKKQTNKQYEWLRKKNQEQISKRQTGQVYYHTKNKIIRINKNELPPKGFIKGRGFSPTKGKILINGKYYERIKI